MRNKEEERKIAINVITYVASAAVKLFITRAGVDLEYLGQDPYEDFAARDIVDCMIGEECGCLEPDDPQLMHDIDEVVRLIQQGTRN